MQITISAAEHERWRTFANQWNKRSGLPALCAVTYVSDGTAVAVRCTNLQYWLEKPIFARADGKGISVVPSDHTVDGSTVTVRQTKQSLTVNGHAVDVSQYEPFALPIPADTLSPTVRCYRADLIHALQFVLPAMKKEPHDIRIHGVRIAYDGATLLAEATDSYRIHQKRIRATALTEPSELVVYATAELVVLLNLLSGTTVSVGVYDETAYLVTERNERIFWQHTLQFPNTAHAMPNPTKRVAQLRMSVHALRNACQSLGKLKQKPYAKTYCEIDAATNQLVLTCAETKNTVRVQLYSPAAAQLPLFALDRYFILDLLGQLPSHATVDVGIYPHDGFAITDWRVVGNDSYYAVISGMTI